jgi:sigma-B regulation protein RsbU (phosphoserine phosphatase)
LNIVFILKVIIGFIVYSLLYFGLYSVLDGQIENAHFVTFFIIILLNLIFDRILRNYYDHYLQAPFQFHRLEQKQILEKLISNLVGSIRYQDAKKILFEAFEKLLPETPHAFYLWDNDRYYLSHYANIDHNINLPISIGSSYFKNINLNIDYLDIEKDLLLPGEKINVLSKANLSELFIFPGQNQIFALLLSTREAKKLLIGQPIITPFKRVQKKAGLILENTGLFIDLERKNFEIKKLIEVSQKVLSSLDIKEILAFILDELNTLISYNAAVIFLLDDDGQSLRSTSSRGYEDTDPEILKLKVGQGSAGFVVQTKEIDVINNVTDAEHYCASRKETVSQISLPFLFDGSVLGVITLESDLEEFFTQNEIELLKMFANMVAVAIHNARQVEIRLAKQAYELELINAATVQKGLLIKHLPRIKDLAVTAENTPSKIVSGDLYDFSKITDDALGIAIGDVAGKGAPAALMMTLVLAGFRSQNKTDSTTCDVVNRMNDLLTQTTIQGKYTTFFYGIIRMDINKIIFTNAGHNPPMLLKKNGDVQYLNTGGIVIGFLEAQSYNQEEIAFEAGDIFVAFTDGVTETMDALENEFGEERIIETIKTHSNKSVFEIKEALYKSLRTFSNFKLNSDDLTIIIAKHE